MYTDGLARAPQKEKQRIELSSSRFEQQLPMCPPAIHRAKGSMGSLRGPCWRRALPIATTTLPPPSASDAAPSASARHLCPVWQRLQHPPGHYDCMVRKMSSSALVQYRQAALHASTGPLRGGACAPFLYAGRRIERQSNLSGGGSSSRLLYTRIRKELNTEQLYASRPIQLLHAARTPSRPSGASVRGRVKLPVVSG